VYCEFLYFVFCCGDARWGPDPSDLPTLPLTVDVGGSAIHFMCCSLRPCRFSLMSEVAVRLPTSLILHVPFWFCVPICRCCSAICSRMMLLIPCVFWVFLVLWCKRLLLACFIPAWVWFLLILYTRVPLPLLPLPLPPLPSPLMQALPLLLIARMSI